MCNIIDGLQWFWRSFDGNLVEFHIDIFTGNGPKFSAASGWSTKRLSIDPICMYLAAEVDLDGIGEGGRRIKLHAGLYK